MKLNKVGCDDGDGTGQEVRRHFGEDHCAPEQFLGDDLSPHKRAGVEVRNEGFGYGHFTLPALQLGMTDSHRGIASPSSLREENKRFSAVGFHAR